MAKKKTTGHIQDIPHEVVPASTPGVSAPLFSEDGKPISQSLDLVTKPAALAMFAASDKELKRLKEVLAATTIAGVDDKDNYKIIFDNHQIAKQTITRIEKTRAALKRQAVAMIDGTAAELDKDWAAVESQYAAARKPVDDELDRIKNEKAIAHAKLVADRIAFLIGHGFNFDGKQYRFEFGVTKLEISPEEINTFSEDDWNVFAVVAEQRHSDKVAFDKEVADQAAQAKTLKEENDRLRAQLAALQAKPATPSTELPKTNEWPDPKGDGTYPAAAPEDPLAFLKVPKESAVGGPPVNSGTMAFAWKSDPLGRKQEEAPAPVAAVPAQVVNEDPGMNTITATLADEDVEYLDFLVNEEAADDRADAIGYCIKSCAGIEKLYGIGAYEISENDVRKPYIEALKAIHAGKAPKGKAFAEWARGIAQTVLQPQ